MKRTIHALIVDDDIAARNVLQKFLEGNNHVIILGSAANTAEAMELIGKQVPDVIFLDINMPREDGLQFAKKLKMNAVNVQIVFTTAYKNYALDAFSLKPVDYLVKPFGPDKVKAVLLRIENNLSKQEENKKKGKIWGNKIPDVIKLKTKSGYSFVDPGQIVYIRAAGAKTELFICPDGKMKVNSILKDIFEEVKYFDFVQINRSVLVNLKYIDRIERKSHKCILSCNSGQMEFLVTRTAFQYLENMETIKLS